VSYQGSEMALEGVVSRREAPHPRGPGWDRQDDCRPGACSNNNARRSVAGQYAVFGPR
jgi:hypothetical protein